MGCCTAAVWPLAAGAQQVERMRASARDQAVAPAQPAIQSATILDLF